jgi:hypothetical protein
LGDENQKKVEKHWRREHKSWSWLLDLCTGHNSVDELEQHLCVVIWVLSQWVDEIEIEFGVNF